jgi:Ser/Thr protein kinase RdoA (MazF antagonist)
MPATSLVYSVLAPEPAKKLVATSYDLGNRLRCRLLAVGITHGYEVTSAGKRHALRIYCRGWRTRSQIAYELAALEHVAARGASVSRPMARRDGGHISDIDAPEGRRPAVLFTWCDGLERVADEAAARSYGEGMALLHNASDDFARRAPSRDLDIDCLVRRPLAIVLPELAHRPADSKRLKRVAAAITREIRRRRSTLSWGFCHGDPCAANAKISNGVTTLFDFDFCGAGWRSYDLANFLWGLSIRKDPAWKGKWRAYLEGYRSRRPLSRADLAAVPLFVAARELWLLGLQLGNTQRWGRAWVGDGYFDFHLKLLWEWSSFRMPRMVRKAK